MGEDRYLLVANGTWPRDEIWQPLVTEAKRIIACDGAAMKCAEMGVKVDAIIGDMDSIDAAYLETLKKEQSTLLVPRTDQTTNDLVKAMYWAIEQGAEHLDLMAVEGGDSGHQFASMMALCEVPFQSQIHTNTSTVELLQNGVYTNASLPRGTVFSLFAIGEVKGVTIKGSEWDLSSVELLPSTRGLHNATASDTLEITWNSGTVLLFLNHRSLL